MSRIIIDKRGIIEEPKGKGVIIDLKYVEPISAGGLIVHASEPVNVVGNDIAVWRDTSAVYGKANDGQLMIFVAKKELEDLKNELKKQKHKIRAIKTELKKESRRQKLPKTSAILS